MGIARSIVVLVDDDRDDQEIFKSAWETVDESVFVIGFENGEQALASLPSMPVPDVIFLDLNMPRLNGLEVLQALKLSSLLKAIPVVIYSTSLDSRVKEKCSILGAVDVMEKPNCFDTLCTRLQSVLHTLS